MRLDLWALSEMANSLLEGQKMRIMCKERFPRKSPGLKVEMFQFFHAPDSGYDYRWYHQS